MSISPEMRKDIEACVFSNTPYCVVYVGEEESSSPVLCVNRNGNWRIEGNHPDNLTHDEIPRDGKGNILCNFKQKGNMWMYTGLPPLHQCVMTVSSLVPVETSDARLKTATEKLPTDGDCCDIVLTGYWKDTWAVYRDGHWYLDSMATSYVSHEDVPRDEEGHILGQFEFIDGAWEYTGEAPEGYTIKIVSHLIPIDPTCA